MSNQVKTQVPDGYLLVRKAYPLLPKSKISSKEWHSLISAKIVPTEKFGGRRAVSKFHVNALNEFYRHHTELHTVSKILQINGADVSYRTLHDRATQQHTLAAIDYGYKHWLPGPILKELIHKETLRAFPPPSIPSQPRNSVPAGFLSMDMVFARLKKHVRGLTFRTFYSWVEKDLVASVKIEGRRLITEEESERVRRFFKTTANLCQASKILEKNGVSISAHALEARIMNGHLEATKFGRLNRIDRKILSKLIKEEKVRKKKMQASQPEP